MVSGNTLYDVKNIEKEKNFCVTQRRDEIPWCLKKQIKGIVSDFTIKLLQEIKNYSKLVNLLFSMETL